MAYEGGCIKNHLQAGQEEAQFLVPLWHALQASSTLEAWFLGRVKGNPSRRVGSLLLQHTFKNLPLKPIYDCWQSDNNALPATPLKETHNWRPKRLASKKYKKTSTDGKRPKYVQRMEKTRTNAQLFGCSWAG